MPRKLSRTHFLSIITLIEWLSVACLALLLITVIAFYKQIGGLTLKVSNSITQKEFTPIASATRPINFTDTPKPSPTETSNLVFSDPQNTIVPLSQNMNGPRGKIVFTCTPEKYNQICLMQADGIEQKRLTDRQANDYYPSIAPDGKSVLYASNQNGQYEIYRLQFNTGLEMKITNGPGNLSAPHISNDGGWIVFAAEFNRNSSIWKLQINGSLPVPLTKSKWNETDPIWSPDNQRIAFARDRAGFVDLFVMDQDGSNIHQITDHPSMLTGRISWSPNSKRLLFSAGPRGDRDIFSVENETHSIKRLTTGGNNTDPCFSPDGHWIAFSSSRDGDHEIFIMHSDGSNSMQLTHNSIDDWQPYWGN